MQKHSRLTRALAVTLIAAITNTMLIGESIAAIAVEPSNARITGDAAAEAVARETRPRVESRIGNSVDAGTGAFILESQALSLQGGRNLAFNIRHNSLLTNSLGPLGFGWSHNFEATLEGDPEGTVTIQWDRNRRNSYLFVRDGEPYTPQEEAVRYDRLTRLTNGSWRLRKPDGTIYEFQANGLLSRVGNKVYQYLNMVRTEGRLTSIEDPISGRVMHLEYAPKETSRLLSIRDQIDRRVFFMYDSGGRLKAVSKPTLLGPEQGAAFVPKSIPDNSPAGLIHTINVSQTGPVGVVQVSLGNISHPRNSDLRVTLISPMGTRAVLFDHTPLSGPLVFDGLALNDFEGENPEGRWNLEIVDNVSGATGTLNGWILRFGEYTGSVRYEYDSDPVEIVEPDPNAIPAPSNLTAYRGRNGDRIQFTVTGSTSGSIYGTDVYTDDSSLAKAAVHAGLVAPGATSVITAVILPGQQSYTSSTRNNVSSSSYGSWSGSYALTRYEPQITSTVSNRVVRAVGPDGSQMFANSFDSLGRVDQQDDGVDTNQVATFDYEETSSGGVKTTYRNRVGDPTVLVHDQEYHLLSTTDPLGNTTSWAYNSAGDRIRAVDALGRTTLFNYDSRGNVITMVDPAGSVSTFEYDSNDNVTKIRDALGKETTFTYDSNNNLTRVRDALGNEDNKSYTGNSQMSGNLMAGRGGINYGYQNGMPVTASHPAESGQARMEYDDVGRMTQMVDLDGYATKIVYSLSDQVVSQTDALGNTSTSEYDLRDRVVRKTDARGNVTLLTYDGNDNLVSTTDALGQITRYEYDGEDRLIRTIDPLGRSSSVTYDAAGRLVKETDAAGESISHAFDAVGNEVATYDARGVEIREVVNDDRNLPVAVRDAFGHTTTSVYDAVGRQTSSRDALSRTMVFDYDELDRPTRVVDPLNRLSSKTYWPDDFTRTLTNPLNNSTEFHYDPARRIDRVTTALGKVTRFQYNRRDLVTHVTKPSGREYIYTYDELGRVASFTTTGPGLIVPVIYYQYDASGNLVTVSKKAFSDIEPVPQLRRSFDALNRMTSYTDAQGNRLDYLYDKAGNLGALVYPDGRTVEYSYDSANRLIEIQDWAGRITRYAYDSNSQLIRVEFPNGTSRSMEYDLNGQVLSRRDLDASGALISGYRYSYDAAGQMTSESIGGNTASYDPPSSTMTYDRDNRLTTFNGQTVSSDDEGNMTRGPLGSSFADFEYDHKNNLIQAGGVRYFYDQEDRLTGYSTEEGTTRLVVSPSGAMSQVLEKTDPDGSQTYYVYGVGLAYEVQGSQIRVYHYDHRGSTTALTSSSGLVTGTITYGPFGEVVQRSGESDALFLFNGLFGVITDPNGLNYMRYRWYNPQIKRFVTADSHYGDIALPHTLNRFAFAGNNPVTQFDPSGEFLNIIGSALVGGIASVAIKIASDAISGKKIDLKSKDYWAEIGGAFVSGAITGGCLGSGVAVVGGAVCGAVGSSAGYLLTQGIKGEQVDPGQLAFEAGVGAASGALGGYANRYAQYRNPPKVAVGNKFRQFRYGFRSSQPGIGPGGGAYNKLYPTQARILSSDEGLLFRHLSRFSKLPSGELRKAVTKAALRRIVAPAAGSLLLKVGGRIASNAIFGAEEEAVSGGGNSEIEDEGRTEVTAGVKGQYGEFIHWRLYIDALMLASRPIPNNPNNVLATF